MTKSLLLKGLAGVAAVGGVVGGGFAFQKQIKGVFSSSSGAGADKPGAAKVKKNENLDNLTHKELIDKAGLDCGLEGDELTDETPKDCTVKTEGTINVKRGDQEKEEGVTFTANGSKLKVSKSEEKGADETDKYNKKLKFVVDSGDISLTKKDGSGAATTIQKLEQFETYEIKKEGDKFYLFRKTEAKEEKIKALGLPSGCSLPESGDSNCSLDTAQIKKVKFQGQESGVDVSSGTVNLKISKVSDDTFPDGYRFTFTFPADLTIDSKTIKTNTPYDFKIKKTQGSNALTLEKAWADDNAFTKKAGLDCSNTSGCTVSSTDPKLNVKVGTQTKEGITTTTGTGKIKMETDQQGYNQGLKFTITTADVSLTGGTGGDAITKLEELETYEITEDGGKYYLTRKGGKEESIKSSLSIPEECFTASGGSCTLSADAFKNINFKDKGTPSASGNITLTVSKGANTTDFPLGYKFTFNTTTEATIGTNENKIKANIPTDFKIKKNDTNPASLTLEKAWSDTKLAEKVGLTCTTGEEGCCTKSGDIKLNVKKGTDKKDGITAISTSPGKIKVEKDQAGYNQGLKFTITGGNVTLTGGSGASFTTLDEYETYEIKEEGDKYYLTRKTEASKTIGDLLGLTDAGCSLSTSSPSCTLSTEQIKKINFDGKDAGGPTMEFGTATLTITSGANSSDFPHGYKFTFKTTTDATITTNTNIIKGSVSTDFKIKKGQGSNTLSLEKAWTLESLIAKVGLQNCNTGSSANECTIGSSLKVKQKSEDGYDDIKQTSLTKKTSSAGSGKIKVTKDVEGYNQGFKFEISEGFIELDGTTGSSENEKITRLGEYETYEIKEDGGEWYLTIKDKADGFILKELGLENISGCTSLKLPRGSTESDCDIKDLDNLKKINFEGKSGHSWTGEVSKNRSIQLQIGLDSSLPSGFKFTFSGSSSTVCLPTGTSGGKVSLQNNNSGVVYKIKKCSKGSSKLMLEKKDNSSSTQCK